MPDSTTPREEGSAHRKPGLLYPYPTAASLRRAWAWQPQAPELKGPSLPRVAHHEAGHVVLMEFFGLIGVSAEASPISGRAFFPDMWHELPEPCPDPSGELAATAAAVFHAGLAAELIFSGVVWCGPVLRLDAVDHQRAEGLLHESFGCHSSGGHAYAQRLALHVLQSRWGRVMEIAGELIERGTWGCPELNKHFRVQETSPIGRGVLGVTDMGDGRHARSSLV